MIKININLIVSILIFMLCVAICLGVALFVMHSFGVPLEACEAQNWTGIYKQEVFLKFTNGGYDDWDCESPQLKEIGLSK
jgi:hypothetical protein